MKDFYMVIYLVKQLMPGDEEALKQHLIKDYVYFHAFRNPAKVFSTQMKKNLRNLSQIMISITYRDYPSL